MYKCFVEHLIPTVNFSPEATEINGMTVRQNQLYKHGKLVEKAMLIHEGLQQFHKWLTGYGENYEVIMVSNY